MAFLATFSQKSWQHCVTKALKSCNLSSLPPPPPPLPPLPPIPQSKTSKHFQIVFNESLNPEIFPEAQASSPLACLFTNQSLGEILGFKMACLRPFSNVHRRFIGITGERPSIVNVKGIYLSFRLFCVRMFIISCFRSVFFIRCIQFDINNYNDNNNKSTSFFKTKVWFSRFPNRIHTDSMTEFMWICRQDSRGCITAATRTSPFMVAVSCHIFSRGY